MSQNKQIVKVSSPFVSRIDAPKQTNFDQYYLDVQIKEVFKATGQKDDEGHELGVAEQKVIVKKIDIHDLLESQRDSVGVDSYIKALAIQGENISDYGTTVSEKIDDFSKCPDNLADTILIGDRAKEAFANLDPALKGGHTTIDGFLNSLTKESVDNYIKAKIEAVLPKSQEGSEN